ncbi:hypothetical protein [Ralstonia phage phiRSL1]|uniref:Uncharacterized protein n=1 Tax=Ralstonia phage phiRSL1 TaxID=1980924 RepID=B2ZXV4_9CAUD|nr:hypothetical protein RSL1_ORF084 [Ralstonia phage phiRSL1]BAG41530.1 hypothetical protein [Ralstonia phage phiRSL1]
MLACGLAHAAPDNVFGAGASCFVPLSSDQAVRYVNAAQVRSVYVENNSTKLVVVMDWVGTSVVQQDYSILYPSAAEAWAGMLAFLKRVDSCARR